MNYIYRTLSLTLYLYISVVPVIRNISQPNQTLLSESVAILCLVTGYPTPTITWQQGATDIPQDERISIFTFLPRLDFNNGTDFTSPGSGVGNITDLLTMNSDFAVDEVTSLGELGVVGVLRIDSVVCGDTGNYSLVPRLSLFFSLSFN